jgi:hypothetical protein
MPKRKVFANYQNVGQERSKALGIYNSLLNRYSCIGLAQRRLKINI